jgi:hypothetical protein
MYFGLFFHPIVIKFESDRHVLVKTLSIKPNKKSRPVGVGIVPCGRMNRQTDNRYDVAYGRFFQLFGMGI